MRIYRSYKLDNYGKEDSALMKKGLLLFLIMFIVSTVLVGCSTETNKEGASFLDNFNFFKATQKIEVTSSDDADLLTTISKNKDIESFVDALKLDDWDWEPVVLPSGALEEKTFKFYRKDASTFKWFNKQKDDLQEVTTMTLYKDVPYIKFDLKKLSFHFEMPEEVHEYLNSIAM